jgi:hypothetical protein
MMNYNSSSSAAAAPDATKEVAVNTEDYIQELQELYGPPLFLLAALFLMLVRDFLRKFLPGHTVKSDD